MCKGVKTNKNQKAKNIKLSNNNNLLSYNKLEIFIVVYIKVSLLLQ